MKKVWNLILTRLTVAPEHIDTPGVPFWALIGGMALIGIVVLLILTKFVINILEVLTSVVPG